MKQLLEKEPRLLTKQIDIFLLLGYMPTATLTGDRKRFSHQRRGLFRLEFP
ncbi:MAG: hypothetical protein V8R91_16665 [Butyricimonas faecihominis]